MKIAISNSNDPYINLATEEILLKDENIKEDLILFYINDNSIIIGRNQNAHKEINSDFVKTHNIKIARRISGGGSVYHDTGNINFSFITNKEKRSYEKFLKPITGFLNTLGLKAEFKGKNDLTVNGYKVSGNAQYIYKERMFHHGTLLFNANLQILGSALKPNKLKLESKGIKSVRQRVKNINEILEHKLSEEDFKNKLFSYFKKETTGTIDLSSYKKNEIMNLSNSRKSYDWIYGKNPSLELHNEIRTDAGTLFVDANIDKNIIQKIRFSGDFLSTNNFETITEYFINQKYTDKNIEDIVNGIKNFEEFFGPKMKREDIYKLLKGIEDAK